jgi:pseudaminic acid cytidylyltransferase
MVKNNFETVFPVSAFSFPILRALQVDKNNKVSMIWPENMSKRSQDLTPAYHDAGQFYWMNVLDIQQNKKLYSDYSGVIILDEMQVQDIDNESDWKLAELKYQLLLQHENPNLN